MFSSAGARAAACLGFERRDQRVEIGDVVALHGPIGAGKSHFARALIRARLAAEGLIEAADLVTEMTLIKHPFRSGIKAQAGVEF